MTMQVLLLGALVLSLCASQILRHGVRRTGWGSRFMKSRNMHHQDQESSLGLLLRQADRARYIAMYATLTRWESRVLW